MALNYSLRVLIKIYHVSVAPNRQLLLNRTPSLDLLSVTPQDQKLNDVALA